jgi:hypothetical protein
MRYAEIDYILQNWEEHKRTRENILAHPDEKVAHPQPGGAWTYETFNNGKKAMKRLTDGEAEIENTYGKDPDGNKVGFYAYKNPCFKWTDMGSDPRMLRALQLARKILTPYGKLPAIQDLTSYAETLERQLGKHEDASNQVPIHFSKVADVDANPEIWEPILEAAAEKRLLKITYRCPPDHE